MPAVDQDEEAGVSVKARSAEEWVGIVELWQRTGLSRKAFAAAAGVNPQTLTWWGCRVRSRAKREPQPATAASSRLCLPTDLASSFVEAKVCHSPAAPPVASHGSLVVVLRGGRRLKIRGDLSEALLTKVVTALEAIP